MQANNGNHQAYNNRLQPLANTLRNNATKAEACLWKYVLRAGQMKCYPFRRQRPVLDYVADFMCQPLMLIIELDGGIHNEPDVTANDLRRQDALEGAGFTILRFSNPEVLQHMDEVRGKISAWIEMYESQNGRQDVADRIRGEKP